jgi:hypothetical protein
VPHHAPDDGGKRNGLKRKVADLLMKWGRTKFPLWVKSRHKPHVRVIISLFTYEGWLNIRKRHLFKLQTKGEMK